MKIQAPQNFSKERFTVAADQSTIRRVVIFLGGGISPWREDLIKKIHERFAYDKVLILDPTRPDWNSNWRCRADSIPFSGQVKWEIMAQEYADLNIYYFNGEGINPTTILEAAPFLHTNPIIRMPEDHPLLGNFEVVTGQEFGKVYTNDAEFEARVFEQIEFLINMVEIEPFNPRPTLIDFLKRENKQLCHIGHPTEEDILDGKKRKRKEEPDPV